MYAALLLLLAPCHRTKSNGLKTSLVTFTVLSSKLAELISLKADSNGLEASYKIQSSSPADHPAKRVKQANRLYRWCDRHQQPEIGFGAQAMRLGNFTDHDITGFGRQGGVALPQKFAFTLDNYQA